MLESLHLKNYRCFDNHEISFRNMNVIVGANNAGKSTLVESLRILSLIVARYQRVNYSSPPVWTSLPLRCKGIHVRPEDSDFRGGSVFHRYGDPPAHLIARFSNRSRIEVLIGPKNEIFGVLYDASNTSVNSKSHARTVNIPRIAILPQIGPLQEREPLLQREYVLRSLDTTLASRHFRNQLHYMRQDYFDDFVRRSENSWRQLHIEPFDVQDDSKDATLNLMVRDANFVAEIGWMGHGLQMWLQTMWFLSRSGDAGTVILDEPDVYMHADLQRRLIRLLKGRTGQKIIATHSVEIMSEVGPADVLIVDKNRRRSEFTTSLPAVQNAIDRLGGVHNIHLARLWNSQRCLHVEGKDIEFLKVLQNTMYPESELPLDLIPRLSIGGWSGWTLAVGSSLSLKNAAGEAIVTYCILDSDYHTDLEIQQRYDDSNKHGVTLHIWGMKEIENYFLVPAAIARVIANKNTYVTQLEVEEQCNKIACDLKDSVFDAMSHEYNIASRATGVHGSNGQARAKLNRLWETRTGRLRVISGKTAISHLSAWSKEKHGVSFGAITIARELKRAEIAAEMRGVLSAIEEGGAFLAGLRHDGTAL